jgi:hypothetical protein
MKKKSGPGRKPAESKTPINRRAENPKQAAAGFMGLGADVRVNVDLKYTRHTDSQFDPGWLIGL